MRLLSFHLVHRIHFFGFEIVALHSSPTPIPASLKPKRCFNLRHFLGWVWDGAGAQSCIQQLCYQRSPSMLDLPPKPFPEVVAIHAGTYSRQSKDQLAVAFTVL